MLFYRIQILLLLVILTSAVQAQPAFSFEELLKKHAATFALVLKNKASNRLQIIYTQVGRDKNNVPPFTKYA